MKDTITALYLKIGNNLKPAISGVISGLTSAVVVSSFIDWLGNRNDRRQGLRYWRGRNWRNAYLWHNYRRFNHSDSRFNGRACS
jgi:hypothetical protein